MPSTSTRPTAGSQNRGTRCKSELLPQPVAPRIATRCPERTFRFTFRSTGSPA